MERRRGVTLLDQLLALVVIGILLAIVTPGIGALRDRLAVGSAARAVRDALALAREHATATGERTAVRFDVVRDRVTVHSGTDTLQRLTLASTHGVSLEATRDSMAYLPSGLGFGASNLRLLLLRGGQADTITVSRLGRVR
jgi:type II secretory pathway pseudopilin PulG